MGNRSPRKGTGKGKKCMCKIKFSVADPWHFGTDQDPDPRICISDQRIRIQLRTLLFFQRFFDYYVLNLHLHLFSKIKSQKESQNSRNQGFSYYFCMMIEGSGSILRTKGPGGPKTYGSGSPTLSKWNSSSWKKKRFKRKFERKLFKRRWKGKYTCRKGRGERKVSRWGQAGLAAGKKPNPSQQCTSSPITLKAS